MICWFRGRRDLALENMALRQQLAVLQRNTKRPPFTDGDRLFWALYLKVTDGWQKVLLIARPRTILDWQKNRFKKFWARRCRRKGPGRPRTDREVQELIRTMSQANPTWGTPRIIGELAKLGITVCKTTVQKYRVRRKGTPSPSWKTFLSNEVKAIAGIDFFTVPTATFRSPCQNPYCERIIGSIRRDCLDHVIIFNEAHLRRILESYFDYYHRCRTHLSLDKDCPEPRATDPPENGNVVAFPQVGGLHNLYSRKAS